MILLVSGATSVVKKYINNKHIGILTTPRKANSLDYILGTGLPWAADNDCFSGFNKDNYTKMLHKISGQERLVYVTAPDVLLNPKETLRNFYQWEPMLKTHKLPIAFVGQDGIENIPIPWNMFDAFFIGGSTEWKLGKHAAELTRQAKSLGKWVHMGRVNSLKRIKYAISLGCDSIDGSGFSKFSEQKIPTALEFIEKQTYLNKIQLEVFA